jgi:hypothetical protein
MMVPKSKLDALIAARCELEQACNLLAQPTIRNLDQCAAVLNSTCRKLASFEAGNLRRDPAALREARQVQKSIGRARKLMEHARSYHEAWTNSWANLSSGYTPRGVPIAPERRGSFRISG